MADFDPDAYLSQKAQSFDPDAYLAQKNSPGPIEQFARNAVNELPAIGGIVGGLAGTPLDAVTGPGGNMLGAGIGGYLGSATKNLINHYIDPQSAPQTTGQVMGQPVMAGVQQATAQGAGDLMSQGVGGLLKKYAQAKAIQATGATGKEAQEFLPGSGQQLLDRGIVKFGSSPANVAENAQQAMDAAEETKQTIVNSLPNVTVDRNSILDSIQGKISSLSGDESKKGLISKLQSAADDVQEQIANNAEKVTPGLGEDTNGVSNLKLDYGKPQNQTINTQPIDSVSPDYSGIPKTVLTAKRPLPARLAQMGAAEDIAQTTNLANANSSGFNPYSPDIDVPVSSVQQTGTIEHPEIPLQQAETVRKGWDANAKWDSSTDVPTRDAAKVVANAYRGATEDAISQADPAMGSAYKAAKRTQQLLIPIQEAAEKRAATLNSSPLGGLGDMAAAGAGGLIGGKPLAAAAVPAKRMLFPRAASALAVTANAAGNAPAWVAPVAAQYGLMASPQQQPIQPPNFSTIPGRNGQ